MRVVNSETERMYLESRASPDIATKLRKRFYNHFRAPTAPTTATPLASSAGSSSSNQLGLSPNSNDSNNSNGNNIKGVSSNKTNKDLSSLNNIGTGSNIQVGTVLSPLPPIPSSVSSTNNNIGKVSGSSRLLSSSGSIHSVPEEDTADNTTTATACLDTQGFNDMTDPIMEPLQTRRYSSSSVMSHHIQQQQLNNQYPQHNHQQQHLPSSTSGFLEKILSWVHRGSASNIAHGHAAAAMLSPNPIIDQYQVNSVSSLLLPATVATSSSASISSLSSISIHNNTMLGGNNVGSHVPNPGSNGRLSESIFASARKAMDAAAASRAAAASAVANSSSASSSSKNIPHSKGNQPPNMNSENGLKTPLLSSLSISSNTSAYHDSHSNQPIKEHKMTTLWGVSALQGRRPYMEDRYCIVPDLHVYFMEKKQSTAAAAALEVDNHLHNSNISIPDSEDETYGSISDELNKIEPEKNNYPLQTESISTASTDAMISEVLGDAVLVDSELELTEDERQARIQAGLPLLSVSGATDMDVCVDNISSVTNDIHEDGKMDMDAQATIEDHKQANMNSNKQKQQHQQQKIDSKDEDSKKSPSETFTSSPSLFAVFDGHGGKLCAEYAQELFVDNLIFAAENLSSLSDVFLLSGKFDPSRPSRSHPHTHSNSSKNASASQSTLKAVSDSNLNDNHKDSRIDDINGDMNINNTDVDGNDGDDDDDDDAPPLPVIPSSPTAASINLEAMSSIKKTNISISSPTSSSSTIAAAQIDYLVTPALTPLKSMVRRMLPDHDASSLRSYFARRALVEAFHKTDFDFIHSTEPNTVARRTGSTAIVVLALADGHVLVANAGDSRAVLCRSSQAIILSVDCKPDRLDEHERIVSAGGFVRRYPKEGEDGGQGRPLPGEPEIRPYRVYTQALRGGLSMSRALGDSIFKDRGMGIASGVCTSFFSSSRIFPALKTDEIPYYYRNLDTRTMNESNISDGSTTVDTFSVAGGSDSALVSSSASGLFSTSSSTSLSIQSSSSSSSSSSSVASSSSSQPLSLSESMSAAKAGDRLPSSKNVKSTENQNSEEDTGSGVGVGVGIGVMRPGFANRKPLPSTGTINSTIEMGSGRPLKSNSTAAAKSKKLADVFEVAPPVHLFQDDIFASLPSSPPPPLKESSVAPHTPTSPALVLSTPEIREFHWQIKHDEFIIVGSDGLWDVVTAQLSVDLVREHLLRPGNTFQSASRLLVDEAFRRGSGDNITAVVFNPYFCATAA